MRYACLPQAALLRDFLGEALLTAYEAKKQTTLGTLRAHAECERSAALKPWQTALSLSHETSHHKSTSIVPPQNRPTSHVHKARAPPPPSSYHL